MVITKKSLLWGATLCAHAVEGADFDSDWWRWEQRPARIKGGDTSERAAGHLQRAVADLDIARKVGCNALQVSISWARIEPEPGRYDDAAMAHYRSVFQAMVQKGIRPLCVLQEHSLPTWFSQQGGWEHAEADQYFVKFVSAVYDAVGPYCTYWIPHYEPLLWLGMAYGEKRWPLPQGGRDRRRALAGIANAHRAVWTYLKEADSKNQVALSLYAPQIYPSDPHSPWDEKIQQQCTQLLYDCYPDMLGAGGDSAGPAYDFIALSCPGTLGVQMAPLRMGNGWAQFEHGMQQPCGLDEAVADRRALRQVVETFSRWNVPILLTGTGCATEDDRERCCHLLDTCDTVLQLHGAGVDLMGLCVRSLCDGFEWHHGFSQRWGLVHVDRTTQARTPNQSAFLYQDIIRSGAIHPGAVSRFAPSWHSIAQEVS